MPLWLRRTTFNLIKEYYDKQNEEAEKQQNALKNNKKDANIARPNIAPNQRYRDWETDRKSTRLNSSHRSLSRMPSSA